MFNPSGDANHASGFEDNPFSFNPDEAWSRFGFDQPDFSPSHILEDPHQHGSCRSFESPGDMDWAPTPSHLPDFHHEEPQNPSQQQQQHHHRDDAASLDLDAPFSPIRGGGGGGGVKVMVAQWENKSYVPPRLPRPIQSNGQQLPGQQHLDHHHQNQHHQAYSFSHSNHNPSPLPHHQSHAQHSPFHISPGSPSTSSHFGSLGGSHHESLHGSLTTAHGQHMPNSINSPNDSHFGSFGAQPSVTSPTAASPQALSFGSFQDASRVPSPISGPSSGPFGSLDDFMSSHRVTSPLVTSPMVTSPRRATPGTGGTPGFEIWRPPGSATPKQSQPSNSPASSDGYFHHVPTIPKSMATGGSQFIIDFNHNSRAKGKAPAKPPRPRALAQTLAASRTQIKREPAEPRSAETGPSGPLPVLKQEEKQQQVPILPTKKSMSQQQQDASTPRTQAGPRPSREQVPAEAWEQHKATIRTLYLDQRKPLKEVMSVMAEKYGFQATPKMYKTRFSQWGFVKNNTEDEVKKLLSMKFQRDAEGKISEFVRNGKVVNLVTYLKRKGVTEYDLVDFELPADLPSHIRCRTPTPPLAQGYLRSPDLVRAQELVVANMRKAFLHCRQFEMDTDAQIAWPSTMAWGALSSELLMEANFYFEARDMDQGGHFLMKAFKQLESDLKKLSPQGIMEMLLGMVNRDLGMITALCKYLAAYSTTNLDRAHPWRLIFTCLYEVQQKHGSATLSELLWASIPSVAEELEAIYGRRHPYVARTWIDLAFFYNHANVERLDGLVPELCALQRQLENRLGAQSADVLALQYAVAQLHYAANPRAEATRNAANELWSRMKSMTLVFPIRESRAYCYHSPVKVDPWTKRCRRRYDAGVSMLEEHVGVKIQPYFEEDFHTTEHAQDTQDAWASAMSQIGARFGWGHV